MDTFSFQSSTEQHSNQNAYQLGRCASLAYKDEQEIKSKTASWGFTNCEFIDSKGTQCFVAG
ncbi:MAG: hypothetical protein HRT88_15830, partial [Lentisphaeraceae bacterium]|nr:hypothetical protein [Lentisphaeraceae bacterium]